MVKDEKGEKKVNWMNSSIDELQAQTLTEEKKERTKTIHEFSNETTVTNTDDGLSRTEISLEDKAVVPMAISFNDKKSLVDDYTKNDWQGNLSGLTEADISNIPRDINLITEETVRRQKDVITPTQ